MRAALTDMALSLGRRAKVALQRRKARFVTREAWRRRHRHVFRLHPEYRRPCPAQVEREHLRLWRRLRRDANVETLRICYNISGRADPWMVPEEVFASEIEPALNRRAECVLLENKAFYDRWFRDGAFPRVHLYNIEGRFYGRDYVPLNDPQVARLVEEMEYPVVIKPSAGRGGGRGVAFAEDPGVLRTLMRERQDFVVQEMIRPHEFFCKYNSRGLSTLRVCAYRSVATGEVHVLNAALRMGRGGSLDNLTQGGLVRFVHPDGRLNHFALDKYGQKFLRHPDTGWDFGAEEVIPRFEELKRLARRVAGEVYPARLVSLDCALDQSGRWRVVEVNLLNQTIRFAQYAGEPFFGPFTAEVFDYCRENPKWG